MLNNENDLNLNDLGQDPKIEEKKDDKQKFAKPDSLAFRAHYAQERRKKRKKRNEEEPE
jgi:hypothetical protein